MKNGQAQPSTEKQSNPELTLNEQSQPPTEELSNSEPTSNWTIPPAPSYMPGALPYLYLFFSQQKAINNSRRTADQAPSSCVLF